MTIFPTSQRAIARNPSIYCPCLVPPQVDITLIIYVIQSRWKRVLLPGFRQLWNHVLMKSNAVELLNHCCSSHSLQFLKSHTDNNPLSSISDHSVLCSFPWAYPCWCFFHLKTTCHSLSNKLPNFSLLYWLFKRHHQRLFIFLCSFDVWVWFIMMPILNRKGRLSKVK